MRSSSLLILAALLFSTPAFSADSSSDDMSYKRTQERLERLEKDINNVQEYVYKGGKKSKDSDGFNGPKGDVKVAEIEEQMRSINGKIEELQNNIDTMSKKFDKIVADVDFRIAALEKANQQLAAANKEASSKEPKENTEAQAELAKALEAPASKAGVDRGEESVMVKDVSDAKEEKKAEEKVAPAENADKAAQQEKVAEEKPIEDKKASKKEEITNQYDKAFQYLRQSKYTEAEKAWKEFIDKNGESDLISNAYYWLGETYYVRSNYELSAVNFLKGYQKLPKGNKAQDNLFKLANSLGKLKKDKEACTTFDKLLKEFPNVDKEIKGKVKEEKTRLKCKGA